MAIKVGRTSAADRTSTLKVGDAAPEFELGAHNSESEPFKLSALRGKKNAVLVFYPFAFTPV